MINTLVASLRKLFYRVFKTEPIRRIVENSSYLLSATGLTMVISVIQGIFVFRMIGPAGIGLLGAIRQFSTNANRLTSFRINEMVVSYIRRYEEEGETEKAAAVFKVAGLFEIGGAVVAFGLIWLLAPWGASFFGQDSSTLSLWLAYGLVILGNGLYESSTGFLHVFNHFRRIAIINAIQSVITLIFIVIAYFSDGGVVEVLSAYILGKITGALFITLTAFVIAKRTWGIDWWRASIGSLKQDRRAIFSFAVSTNFSHTITMIAKESETLWASAFLGLSAAGYYRLALDIMSSLKLPVVHLAKTTYPELSREIANKRWLSVKDILQRGSRLAAVYSLPIFLGLVFFGKFAMEIMYTADSLPAYPLVIILAIGHTFDNIFFWNRVALLALNRPVFPTIVNLIGMLLKVGAVFLFVKNFGAIAFAAILAGYFVFTVGASAVRVIKDLNERSTRVSALEGSA